MHLEAHIDTVFAWRPLPMVDADNCNRGRRVWGRRVWRNRTLWIGDTPVRSPRGLLTDGQLLSEIIHYKDLECDPRVPGTATVVSCRPPKPCNRRREDCCGLCVPKGNP